MFSSSGPLHVLTESDDEADSVMCKRAKLAWDLEVEVLILYDLAAKSDCIKIGKHF